MTIDPDRFGRLNTTVWFSPPILNSHNHQLISHVVIDGLQSGKPTDYAKGDDVRIRIVGGVAKLGRILRHGAGCVLPYPPEHCFHCSQEITMINGNFFCPGENCPGTYCARMSYAAREDILDLQLGEDTIKYIVGQGNIANTLPELLSLEPYRLIGSQYDASEADLIVAHLQDRADHLYGRNCSPDVQSYTQNQALAALSLRGLYNRDRITLQHELHQGVWTWDNLPDVMTDRPFLMRRGITSVDSRNIVAHASDRIEELSSLARNF
jgi:hypothetical protein